MPATLQLDPDALLTTTRSVRKRLDLERPVPDDVLRECLEIATQAPTGSNAQGWQFLVVRDPEKRRAVAELYKKAFDAYRQMNVAAGNLPTTSEARQKTQERVISSAEYLAERLEQVPVFLIPCMPGRFDKAPSFAQSSVYGSIFPAVWSFMLAARARGLGTVWTSLHLMFEEEAAGILGIPYADVTQTALIPVAYTKGTDFKPAPREPLDTVVHWDTW